MTGWNRIDRGTGEPLVLLHGGGASACSWLPVVDLLASRRRVIAFDFPGFGRTPAIPDTTLTMDWAMEQLAGELARIGIDTPVDMAGNSMGGWMALEAAKRGLARSVVAIGPAGLWAKGMPLLTRAYFFVGLCTAWVIRTPLRAIFRIRAVRAATLFLVLKHPDRMTFGEVVGLVADLHTSTPVLLRALRVGFRTRFEDGQHITVPVTLAFGSHDRMVPARNSRFRDQLPPHTKWVTLPDCGHTPMWDNPELVAATILDGTSEKEGIENAPA